MPGVVPVEDRYPRLKEFLIAQSRAVADIKRRTRALVPDTVNPFLYLSYPWVGEPADLEQARLLELRRAQFAAAGFDGDGVRAVLGDMLAHDKHLRECCVGPGPLAECIDLAFITPALPLIGEQAPPGKLDELFRRFEATIYGQGRFRAISLCHIFNFQADEPSLRFSDTRVERLDGPTISRILGETSGLSFLHPPGTGDYFVVSELEGACDDHIKWLYEEKNKAELFVRVLQYFKDGVVHINYAAPHFQPEWVNQIRKWGIFFIGNLRRLPYEGGRRFYTVGRDERDSIARWWTAYQNPALLRRIDDLRHSLRQAGLRAGEYFELSHTQDKPADRLISLAIALEALLSPDDRGEFTFRIAQSLGQLVGMTPEERLGIFRDTKEFYSRRSQLIHGQYDVDAYLGGRFVTHEECERWASPIRQAILRFLVLYLRGKDERNDVHSALAHAALDAEAAKRLRSESDPETYLAEVQSGNRRIGEPL